MKIQRELNGQMVELELTPEELTSAYYEQQHVFDIQDVRDKFEGETDPGEIKEQYGMSVDSILSNDSLLEEIADESRRNQDKYGMDWEYARDNAIKEVLERHRDELLPSSPETGSSVLPESCYSVLHTGELIVIKRGELGYYVSDWSSSDPAKNCALADEYNAEMGVTKAQAAAMQAGSLFGWNVPAANPEAYDENGQLMRDSLSDKIAAAEQKQKVAEETMVEMSYGELARLFRNVEASGNGHVSGCVVFTEDSFTQPYSEASRTYAVSSDNKAFQSGMSGYSIFGSCLDGTDPCVRLEAYMAAEKGGKDGWKIERCYMSQAELNKANGLIQAARETRNEEER